MVDVQVHECPKCGDDLYIDDLNAAYQCLKCVKKLVWSTVDGERRLVERKRDAIRYHTSKRERDAHA